MCPQVRGEVAAVRGDVGGVSERGEALGGLRADVAAALRQLKARLKKKKKNPFLFCAARRWAASALTWRRRCAAQGAFSNLFFSLLPSA